VLPITEVTPARKAPNQAATLQSIGEDLRNPRTGWFRSCSRGASLLWRCHRANPMGARVTAISRGSNKVDEARALGSTGVIATVSRKASRVTRDRSISRSVQSVSLAWTSTQASLTAADPDELSIAEYLPLLGPHGTFVIVGVIPKPRSIPIFALLDGESS
jgi:D-arabinose 1-dehydrogenase-like Zn-dependent alcohol dehydrogenase